jgi:hypothetical protein
MPPGCLVMNRSRSSGVSRDTGGRNHPSSTGRIIYIVTPAAAGLLCKSCRAAVRSLVEPTRSATGASRARAQCECLALSGTEAQKTPRIQHTYTQVGAEPVRRDRRQTPVLSPLTLMPNPRGTFCRAMPYS